MQVSTRFTPSSKSMEASTSFISLRDFLPKCLRERSSRSVHWTSSPIYFMSAWMRQFALLTENSKVSTGMKSAFCAACDRSICRSTRVERLGQGNVLPFLISCLHYRGYRKWARMFPCNHHGYSTLQLMQLSTPRRHTHKQFP